MKKVSTDSVGKHTKENSSIELLKPLAENENSVFEALKLRKTTREISNKKLPIQILSNLLWAASGVNRKKGPFNIPGRTSATASNSHEIDVYVALEEGIYLYDPIKHILNLILNEDLRRLAIGQGQESFGAKAPVRLVYVADIYKLSHTAGYHEPGLQDPEIQKSYYFVDTGLIAGNVYLYAASVGLAAWFHNCNRSALKTKLKLPSDQRILFGQTVGFPKKNK